MFNALFTFFFNQKERVAGHFHYSDYSSFLSVLFFSLYYVVGFFYCKSIEIEGGQRKEAAKGGSINQEVVDRGWSRGGWRLDRSTPWWVTLGSIDAGVGGARDGGNVGGLRLGRDGGWRSTRSGEPGSSGSGQVLLDLDLVEEGRGCCGVVCAGSSGSGSGLVRESGSRIRFLGRGGAPWLSDRGGWRSVFGGVGVELGFLVRVEVTGRLWRGGGGGGGVSRLLVRRGGGGEENWISISIERF